MVFYLCTHPAVGLGCPAGHLRSKVSRHVWLSTGSNVKRRDSSLSVKVAESRRHHTRLQLRLKTRLKKFQLSYSDKHRYEMEERPDVQKQILVEIARKLPIFTRAQSGAIRFCDRCQVLKPDRCHHCSVCETCVLKMDHHCPWVNNCVGFSNYKFFLLFLSYSILYCVFIATTVCQYFLKFWVGELPNGRAKFHVLFLMFVAVMFFVSLMFLFSYHCWLVAKNRSTLEAFSAPVFVSGPDRNGFNVGVRRNVQQILGEDRRLWLVPVFTRPGNGHYFPLKNQSSESHNPLLANEDMWEESDDGSDAESQGEDHDPSVTIEIDE
ncbi:hypothetical protein fugu_013237 [Takifugu bimaculatus]|uniref:Palmitoyltransferase n=1 Tax=Takifugu bimaculatus TaxID=433685 RepID=A0A4Z2C2N3_9TELE|nr:hypothetical protein fugu_013237 [Takifugu bimaculatus]